MTTGDRASASKLPLMIAVRNALGMVALLWVLLGIINFGLLTDYLVKTSSDNLLRASFWLSLGFGSSCAIVVAVIVVWQRRHGETLAELGWRKPTRPRAVVMAVFFGFLWTSGAYTQPGANPASFLAFPWERPIMMLVGVLMAFGEELAMRGFFMEQLRRGGVSTSLQVIAAGLAMGSYHGLIGFHYSVLYAFFSAVIFSIVGVIFVVGRRSLTPVLIAHAMTHFFGDPELLMGLLRGAVSMGR